VFNAPSKTNIHFQQDRITHSDVSKYGRQLDVQSMYADKTDVFNLETEKFMSITSGNVGFSDIAIFGTNVVFLEDTDEIIANTDLEGSDIIYSSRLLEIEDELVTA